MRSSLWPIQLATATTLAIVIGTITYRPTSAHETTNQPRLRIVYFTLKNSPNAVSSWKWKLVTVSGQWHDVEAVLHDQGNRYMALGRFPPEDLKELQIRAVGSYGSEIDIIDSIPDPYVSCWHADFNGDGVVGGPDYTLYRQHHESTCQ